MSIFARTRRPHRPGLLGAALVSGVGPTNGVALVIGLVLAAGTTLTAGFGSPVAAQERAPLALSLDEALSFAEGSNPALRRATLPQNHLPRSFAEAGIDQILLSCGARAIRALYWSLVFRK